MWEAITGLVTLAGIIFANRSQTKREDLGKRLESLLRAFTAPLSALPTQSELREYASQLANELGISAASPFITTAVERIYGELAAKLLPKSIESLTDAAASVRSSFTPKGTIPKF